MARLIFWLVTLAMAAWPQDSGPSYSAEGLVNLATGLPGPLAPNTWAAISGSNLAWSETAAGAGDLRDNTLPTQLGGVRIMVSGGTLAPLKLVSPTRINFLVPVRGTGDATMRVSRDGWFGPTIPIMIVDVSPALFQAGAFALATHPDGTAVDSTTPAMPGEVITLSATGLGQTQVPLDAQDSGKTVEVPADPSAIRIARFADLAVTLNAVAVDAARIRWAGLTPGFAGVYQIVLQLPDRLDANPDIQIWIGDQASPPGVKLAAQASGQALEVEHDRQSGATYRASGAFR